MYRLTKHRGGQIAVHLCRQDLSRTTVRTAVRDALCFGGAGPQGTGGCRPAVSRLHAVGSRKVREPTAGLREMRSRGHRLKAAEGKGRSHRRLTLLALTRASAQSKLDAALSEDPLLVSVLDLTHLRDRIGELNQNGMSITAREDDVHHLRLLPQHLRHLFRIEHLVTDGVVDLIEKDEVPLARQNSLGCLGPGLLDHAKILRIGLRPTNLHEAAAQLPDDKVLAHRGGRIKLAVVPRALEELQNQHAHPIAGGTERSAQSRSRLTPA